MPEHGDGLRARGHEVEVLAGHAPMASSTNPPYVHRTLALRGLTGRPP